MSEDRARRDFDDMASRPLPPASFWGRMVAATPAVVALIAAASAAWIVLVAARMIPWSS